MYELIADDLVLIIKSKAGDITLGQLKIAGTLCLGSKDGSA
jgi:hypothetical protein